MFVAPLAVVVHSAVVTLDTRTSRVLPRRPTPPARPRHPRYGGNKRDVYSTISVGLPQLLLLPYTHNLKETSVVMNATQAAEHDIPAYVIDRADSIQIVDLADIGRESYFQCMGSHRSQRAIQCLFPEEGGFENEYRCLECGSVALLRLK